MYNVDKYFDFDYEKKSEIKVKKKKKQQQQTILLLLLAAGAAYYYFMIYLPDEEVKKLETKLKKELDRVKNAQPDDVAEMLTTLQTYKQWANGSDFQKRAFANKQSEFNEAMKWLQEHQKTPQQIENEHFLKGRVWSLPAKSWADKEIKKISNILVSRYSEETKMLPGGDNHPNFRFSRAASYDIHFPPSMEEFLKLGKERKKSNCYMLTKNEDLIWSTEIQSWYNQVMREKPPWRGNPNPSTKRDNNAIFFGAPGTGKSATVKKICIEADECPLIIVKGSSLSCTKQDHEAGILPLQKFVYTISELEWTLVKIYGMEREKNGEVRYILLVDECDQISNNTMIHDPNRLRFLKELLEGSESSRKEETQNLWIFATNHLKDVESATYREGRLSNPLDFSWTWGEFKKYFVDVRSNPTKYELPSWFKIPDMPKRWRDTHTLDEEDNKWVNRFNKFSFVSDFLGYDPEKPSRPKFWERFITKNPDAISKEEVQITDGQGNSKTEMDEIEIEIGEFLQFFWNLKDGGQLANYDGDYESPRIPKEAEVLDDNLPNLGEMARLIGQSSNALNKSLENLNREIQGLKQKIQASGGNSGGIQNQITQLRQQLADLAKKVYSKY